MQRSFSSRLERGAAVNRNARQPDKPSTAHSAAFSSIGDMAHAARVLLVEDDEDTRQMYTQFLEFFGFEIQGARDGLEALQRAAVAPPDAIVMDLAMPRLDGFEATRRLKSNPATARIPVLVLTAFGSSADRARAFQAGADDFLTKPCELDTLASRLEEHLQRPH
jgi:DNA-binding response OmpR family regulator